jgi:acetylornithine deacetylase
MKIARVFLIAAWHSFSQAAVYDNSQHHLQDGIAGDIPPYRDTLISLHKSLITIPSVTGNEGNVADFLDDYLQSLGFTVELQPVLPGSSRANVFAYTGKTRQTRSLVTSHIDTVPPFLPYSYTPASSSSSPDGADLITGRGAVDAKGSVAAQIAALHSLLPAIHDSDVALLFVAGEEAGGAGMRAANDLGLSWETVIFGEPTERKLACGHKGALGFIITAKGKTGHSGYPSTGRNAIDALVDVLAELKRVQLPWSEKFGNTTVNVGLISGGIAGNVIPDRAEAKASVRVAGASPEEIRALVQGAVGQAAKGVDAEVSVEFTPGLGEVRIDCDVEGEFFVLIIPMVNPCNAAD